MMQYAFMKQIFVTSIQLFSISSLYRFDRYTEISHREVDEMMCCFGDERWQNVGVCHLTIRLRVRV